MGMNGRYEWVDGTVLWSGGVAAGYHDFRGGAPDDDPSQACIQLDLGSGGQWADHPCSDATPFVCEGAAD